MTEKKNDIKTEIGKVPLNDEQLDEVSGGLVNEVNNPNKGMLGSATMDKVTEQKYDSFSKN